MKLNIRNLSSARVGGGSLLAAVVFAISAASAQSAVYVAFGVDTLTASPNFNQIGTRDLHGDHYHRFVENNGTPGSHTPQPFTIMPGSGAASLTLASMDISPYSQGSFTTSLTPGGDFHLELTGLSGIGADNMTVRFWHGDHTHTMSVGGNAEHLSLSEVNQIDFVLAEGSAMGNYSARFRIVDESGNYSDSPTFSINANAVPEPSAALLGGIAFGLGVLRRKRHS